MALLSCDTPLNCFAGLCRLTVILHKYICKCDRAVITHDAPVLNSSHQWYNSPPLYPDAIRLAC